MMYANYCTLPRSSDGLFQIYFIRYLKREQRMKNLITGRLAGEYIHLPESE